MTFLPLIDTLSCTTGSQLDMPIIISFRPDSKSVIKVSQLYCTLNIYSNHRGFKRTRINQKSLIVTNIIQGFVLLNMFLRRWRLIHTSTKYCLNQPLHSGIAVMHCARIHLIITNERKYYV